MKVLKVTQSYYPFVDRGGPAVKVRALARGLADRGEEVTVLTADLGLRRIADSSNGWIQERWGWRSQEGLAETVYLRSRAAYRSLTWNPGIFAFCRERLASFDVVHIYGLYDLLGPAVARGCRHQGVPYVIEPMGMFRPIIRNIPLKRVYRGLLGNSMVHGAQRVVATSAQEQRELVEEGVPDDKIIVRRNGIERPERLPPQGTFRQQWRIQGSAKIVLFLGRLVTKKSPELLLEAFARWRGARATGETTPPAVLVMAGPDEGEYRKKLETHSAQLGLGNGVRFTGPLYDDAKWSAYQDADLFVLPSQNENFGNTAAEAVACGTPVLVTDRCGVAPLVDGRAGLVVPHDCDALAAGLERLLGPSGLAEQFRQGCADVAQSLGWEEPLDATQLLYADLVQKRRRER
jgi:glycosyltransferase involved in cell wall biosynthesis